MSHATLRNIDRYGRVIDYLRIAVTDRCNLRCVYCMPPEGLALAPREALLSFEEIWRIAGAARGLGFVKYRVTGGEPLVVRDIVGFLAGLRRVIGDAVLGLTTNGTRLADLAPDLCRVGVDRLNVSLDTLDPTRYQRLTRRDQLAAVLRGVDRALEVGFERVKINAVIVPGVNDHDLVDLASLARERDVEVRFIERMPLDEGADRTFLGADEMLQRLRGTYALERVPPEDFRAAAQLVYRSPALKGRIAIVAPRSKKFCHDCHRMRLTPAGEIKGCLLSEGSLDLRAPLRAGLDDAGLEQHLLRAIGAKPKEYRDERYGLDRSMRAIGG